MPRAVGVTLVGSLFETVHGGARARARDEQRDSNYHGLRTSANAVAIAAWGR
jgi:hypothetical protein